jgi:translocation and assembly module TamA
MMIVKLAFKHRHMAHKKLIFIALCGLLVGPALAKTTLTFDINGLEDAPLKNAQSRLDILKKSAGTLYTTKIKVLYHEGKTAITKAIEPYGFFKARVTSHLAHKDNNWVATYHVRPGQQLRISTLNLVIKGPGQHNRHLLRTLKHLTLKQGQPLNVPKYRSAKATLLTQAHNQGYIKAALTKDKVTVNLVAQTIDISLTLNTGPRFYFGKITFGKSPFALKFLRRFRPFREGEPFSTQKLNTLQSNYDATGYFKSVNIVPNIPTGKNTSTRIPVHTTFQMDKKKMYQIGLGYGTVSGPRIKGSVNWRWINRYGQKFKLSIMRSRVMNRLTAQYLIPASRPMTDHYSISASIFEMTPPHKAKAFVKKLGVGYLVKRQKWTWNFGLDRVWERWRLGKSDGYTNSKLLIPSISASYASTNNTILVENGFRLYVALQGAYKPALSSVSFLQPLLNFKIIQTLWKSNRFIFSFNGGYTIVHGLKKLPLSQRFYAGGQGSLLGFGYQAIGPGRYLTVANAAYQRQIHKAFYGEVFYGAGNAFNTFKKYATNLKRSAGLAVVWRSPIGDLKVYWAKALSSKKKPNRFGFLLESEL